MFWITNMSNLSSCHLSLWFTHFTTYMCKRHRNACIHTSTTYIKPLLSTPTSYRHSKECVISQLGKAGKVPGTHSALQQDHPLSLPVLAKNWCWDRQMLHLYVPFELHPYFNWTVRPQSWGQCWEQSVTVWIQLCSVLASVTNVRKPLIKTDTVKWEWFLKWPGIQAIK